MTGTENYGRCACNTWTHDVCVHECGGDHALMRAVAQANCFPLGFVAGNRGPRIKSWQLQSLLLLRVVITH